MSVQAAPQSASIRQALRAWSTSNDVDIGNLSVEQKQQAIADVSESLDMRPVDVLRKIEALFPSAFGAERGAHAMQKLGASYTYRPTSEVVSQTGRLLGTRMLAMMGAGFMPTKGQLNDFLNADTPAAIRERAGQHADMTKGYALFTAEQLFDDVKVPPRAQTVARKALQKLVGRTASHFSPDGFVNIADDDVNQRALGQHAGYVAGNLSRQFGIDEDRAREAIIVYYSTGGDIDRLIAELGPNGPQADFFKDNGWMVGGGYGDDGKWGFWGFGDADKAMNRPGIYAGEATLEFAEAMSPGNGEELMASMLAKNPAEWNDKEAAVGQFGLRAAQAGWLTAKTGQGIVEAHNPKKEARSLKRWAPGNDLVCDFNTLKERKDWGEIAKDLDQIRNAARGMGIGRASRAKATPKVSQTIIDDSRVQVDIRDPQTGVTKSFVAEMNSPDDDELEQLTDDLVDGARAALAESTFAERNDVMADVVGNESGTLAAQALGLSGDAADVVKRGFKVAARRAGKRFSTAFTVAGQPKKAAESDYKAAMSAAGGEALGIMAKVADKASLGRIDASGVVEQARLEDIAQLVANDLGFDESVAGMSGEALAETIADVVPEDDYYHRYVDDLPTRQEGDAALDDEQRKMLGLGIRLANATWKTGQVHRAAWEGRDDRINPEKRTAFNTFDTLKQKLYDDTLAEQREKGVDNPEQAALARVVFEVYKGLIQLQKAVAAE